MDSFFAAAQPAQKKLYYVLRYMILIGCIYIIFAERRSTEYSSAVPASRQHQSCPRVLCVWDEGVEHEENKDHLYHRAFQ